MVGKSDGRKLRAASLFPLASLTPQPMGRHSPHPGQVLFSQLILSRSMLTDISSVCLADVLDLQFTGKINQYSTGYQVWVPLDPPKHEILTLSNNETKGAQQHLVPQTLGQINLAAAFALTGTTIPYPGSMVGTLEEPPLPSELLVLGSLHALPCLLG